MIVPNYSQDKIVNEDGTPTENFSSFMRNLFQNMQLSLSEEGYLIPSVSSEPGSSETPPNLAFPSQLQVLQASFQPPGAAIDPNTQTVTVGVQIGTIIFDPYELNGGSVGPPRVPKGQLKVLLNDGTFHPITNT